MYPVCGSHMPDTVWVSLGVSGPLDTGRLKRRIIDLQGHPAGSKAHGRTIGRLELALWRDRHVAAPEARVDSVGVGNPVVRGHADILLPEHARQILVGGVIVRL